MGKGALTQLCLKPSPQKPSFCPTFLIKLSKRGGWGKDSKSLQKECIFKIQKSNGNQAPLLPAFRPQ